MTPVFAANGLKSALLNNPSLSEYFSGQFANITPWNVLVALLYGAAMGLVIAFVYRKCYRGVLYSPSFAMTLVMLTIITTPVVMCIKSDIALSMGMVGALSIVRFRTAIKDPMDTAYMFWALTMGILLGAGLHLVAVAVALGISAIIFAMSLVKFRKPDAYLLVLHYDETAEYAINEHLNSQVKNRRLRSKTVTRNGAEMTVEVRVTKTQDLISEMLSIEGVYDATLVSCQTEAGL